MEEAPLLVPPDAVLISTIHGVKGLEFAAVFLADMNARRFPSVFARRVPELPFGTELKERVKAEDFADNENNDDERRLLYVAITRAERYLFISSSGQQQSKFFRDISKTIIECNGGEALGCSTAGQISIVLAKTMPGQDRARLVTSFSDVRYFLECPHDFYLRKVMGFAPTIDQAFGYGRGVHNLLRAVHSDARFWASIASDQKRLKQELGLLIEKGLLYLRYTVGDPRQKMEAKAMEVVSEYIKTYATELETLEFRPEAEFETLLPEEEILVSGAIDIIRLDHPPRVTLIDFKSGEVESDIATKLDEEEMRFQLSLYGLAAKQELEYEPDRGLVRYLGETDPALRELNVPLGSEAINDARAKITKVAGQIRGREFNTGPTKGPRDESKTTRCAECDFVEFCGQSEAESYRKTLPK